MVFYRKKILKVNKGKGNVFYDCADCGHGSDFTSSSCLFFSHPQSNCSTSSPNTHLNVVRNNAALILLVRIGPLHRRFALSLPVTQVFNITHGPLTRSYPLYFIYSMFRSSSHYLPVYFLPVHLYPTKTERQPLTFFITSR